MKKNFELVYKSLKLAVKRFIAKRSGASEEVVEEIFSQTMIAAWHGFRTFKHKSSYFTWICKIALYKIADYYRREIHYSSTFVAPFIEDLVDPESTSMLEQMALSDLQSAVRRVVGLLPPETQKIIHLRYWEEASIAEIARALGTSPKAAESKLYRARKALAKML